MDNWYKVAKVTTLLERNIANEKIHYLEDVARFLVRISKVVFQSGHVAKSGLKKILDKKKLDAYTSVNKLIFAAHDLCLDSPYKVRLLCLAASEELIKKINKLVAERKAFRTEEDVKENILENKKGLVYDRF